MKIYYFLLICFFISILEMNLLAMVSTLVPIVFYAYREWYKLVVGKKKN